MIARAIFIASSDGSSPGRTDLCSPDMRASLGRHATEPRIDGGVAIAQIFALPRKSYSPSEGRTAYRLVPGRYRMAVQVWAGQPARIAA